MFEPAERRYVEAARVARLATADTTGRPHVVPVCFAVVGEDVVTPIDEKPQAVRPERLRRSLNVEANPHAALVVDHYTDDWARLGWVQVRGRASVDPPAADGHGAAVSALRKKYEQYANHALEDRPIIRLAPETVRSWGRLTGPE